MTVPEEKSNGFDYSIFNLKDKYYTLLDGVRKKIRGCEKKIRNIEKSKMQSLSKGRTGLKDSIEDKEITERLASLYINLNNWKMFAEFIHEVRISEAKDVTKSLLVSDVVNGLEVLNKFIEFDLKYGNVAIFTTYEGKKLLTKVEYYKVKELANFLVGIKDDASLSLSKALNFVSGIETEEDKKLLKFSAFLKLIPKVENTLETRIDLEAKMTEVVEIPIVEPVDVKLSELPEEITPSQENQELSSVSEDREVKTVVKGKSKIVIKKVNKSVRYKSSQNDSSPDSTLVVPERISSIKIVDVNKEPAVPIIKDEEKEVLDEYLVGILNDGQTWRDAGTSKREYKNGSRGDGNKRYYENNGETRNYRSRFNADVNNEKNVNQRFRGRNQNPNFKRYSDEKKQKFDGPFQQNRAGDYRSNEKESFVKQ